MSDELDRLSKAMDAATPEPSSEARLAALKHAEENFERLQGSRDAARPSSERAGLARLWTGVLEMLERIGTKGALVASTGVALVAAVWVSQNMPLTAPDEIVLIDAAPAEAGKRSETRDRAVAGTPDQSGGARSQVVEEEIIATAPTTSPAAEPLVRRGPQAIEELRR